MSLFLFIFIYFYLLFLLSCAVLTGGFRLI